MSGARQEVGLSEGFLGVCDGQRGIGDEGQVVAQAPCAWGGSHGLLRCILSRHEATSHTWSAFVR